MFLWYHMIKYEKTKRITRTKERTDFFMEEIIMSDCVCTYQFPGRDIQHEHMSEDIGGYSLLCRGGTAPETAPGQHAAPVANDGRSYTVVIRPVQRQNLHNNRRNHLQQYHAP